MQTRPPSEHGRSRVLFGGAVALVALVAAVVGIAAYGGDSPAETTRERTSPAQRAPGADSARREPGPPPPDPAMSVLDGPSVEPRPAEGVAPLVVPVTPELVAEPTGPHACVGRYARRIQIDARCHFDEVLDLSDVEDGHDCGMRTSRDGAGCPGQGGGLRYRYRACRRLDGARMAVSESVAGLRTSPMVFRCNADQLEIEGDPRPWQRRR